jgi:DNA-binding LacI/PurR family transcriptional regulator
MMSVIIKDVARRARVSVGTISSTMSGKQHVAEKIRQRVLEAIDELGYRHNIIAKSLAKQRTYTIGVIAYGVGYYGPLIVADAEEEAKEQGYQMAMGAVHAVTERGLHVPQNIAIVGFDNIPESARFVSSNDRSTGCT